MNKPKVNSEAQKEIEKAQESFDKFHENLKDFNPLSVSAPVDEKEPQTRLSTREANKMDAPYIKPIRSINSKEAFNEKYRKQWEEGWQYVKCIVENHEIIGEAVEVWTKRFAGDSAHFWRIPVNKPIMIPRLLAEQLAKCQYHRLIMEDRPVEQGHMGTITGALV